MQFFISQVACRRHSPAASLIDWALITQHGGRGTDDERRDPSLRFSSLPSAVSSYRPPAPRQGRLLASLVSLPAIVGKRTFRRTRHHPARVAAWPPHPCCSVVLFGNPTPVSSSPSCASAGLQGPAILFSGLHSRPPKTGLLLSLPFRLLLSPHQNLGMEANRKVDLQNQRQWLSSLSRCRPGRAPRCRRPSE